MAQIASASDVLVSRHGRPTPRKPKVAPTSLPEAKAVYGETGGLFPQKNDPSRSIYNPGNWNPTSLRQLTIARIWIAEVQRRNSNVNYAELNGSKLIDVIQWNMALGAASAASNSSPAGVRHFFIRPTIDGRTRPPFVGTKEPLATFGPFVNVGGGDVARGDNIYIDFYENIP